MSHRGWNLARKFHNSILMSLAAIFCLLSPSGAVAQTTVSATSISFGYVVVNATSPLKTVKFTNTGASAISITSITLTPAGPYALATAPSAPCPNSGSLAAGASCNVGVTMSPTVLGVQPAATLTINSTAVTGGTQTVALIGTGVTPTALSSGALPFGNQVVGTTSSILSLSLTNYQLTPLTIDSITPSAEFSVASTTCGTTLAAGAKCVISVTFTPTSTLPIPASTLTVTTNAPDSPKTASLSGVGIVPTVVSPTTVNFGNVTVGTTSALNIVTLTNNQTTSLNISSLSGLSGTPYAINPSSTCLTLSVAPGASCTIALTVSPALTGTGPQPAGTLTISTNASNSPQTVSLSATGVAQVVLSPNPISFGYGMVGGTSAPKLVQVKNNTPATVALSSAIFNGPFVLDTAATTCPQSGGAVGGPLPANGSCIIGIDFAPTAKGPTTGGQITLLDSAANSPQTVSLSGTGVIPVGVFPGGLDFHSVAVGTTSATNNITLINYQSVALNLTSISVAAPFFAVAPTSGTPCVVGTPLAPSAQCTVGVAFTAPSIPASATGTLNISDSASNSPQSVALSGTGVVPVSLASTLNFGNVVLNQVATQNIQLHNNQSIPLNISSISGFTGGYSLNTASTTCSLITALPAGQQCVIAVNLTATSLGVQPAASFSVFDDAPTSPQVVNLIANAVAPVSLNPNSIIFPATLEGHTSAAINVQVGNNSSVPLTVNSANVVGPNASDFSVGSSCPTAPSTVPAGGHCQLNVTFSPTASGVRSATLNLNDTALGSPQTVLLRGSGNPPVLVSPNTTQGFNAYVGTTSPFRTFTITNEQLNTPLVFSPFILTGDFIQSATTCPIGGIGLGGTGAIASCTVSVEFNPSIGGIRNGQLQVYNNAFTSPQVVNLAGTAFSPLTISPTFLSFTSQTVGTVSPAKTITLVNHETESETFSIAAVGSLAAGDYQASSNCASGVIPALGTCLIFVNFTPTSISPSPTRGGSLTITDSAPGGTPLIASLTGSAIATPPPAAVASVSPGAGSSGTAVPVVITGNGWTHFNASSAITFVETNSTTTPCNIAVSGQALISPNQINATLTLSGGIFGACNIKVVSPLSGGGNETASLVSAFNLADPTLAHTITAVNPAFGTQGQSLNVAITAVGTHFVQGVTIANFGDGVRMNSLTITDGTHAAANITISNTTPIGYRTVTMQTNGEFAVSQLTLQNNPIFQIGANSATLVSISPQLSPVIPTVVPQGFSGQLYLTATGTHFLQNATTVSIGGVIVGDVNVTSLTTAVVEVAVPALAPVGFQNATVSTGGEIASLNNAISIAGATPVLISVVPSSGKQGDSLNVVITGNSFTNFVAGNVSADFTGEISSPTVNVNTPHQVTVPITIHPDASVGSITANLVSGTTNFPFTFTVTPSSASIMSVSPTCVPQGAQVTLTVVGSNTLWVQGTTMAAFYPAGVPVPSVDEVTINSATSASLAIAVPTNSPAGTYGFYIATGGQIVSSSIKVCPATPTLTMSPANGLLPTAPAVNSFTVNFTGQFTHWGPTTLPVVAGQGVTLSSFQVNSPVSAQATLTIIGGTNGTPTATGPRLVTFTTGGEIVTTYFNVTQTPVGIIYVTPDHTPPSTTVNVAIFGLNTHFNAATTQVLFGPQITVNTVTVTDATHLTANITTSYMLSSVLTPSPSGWQNIFVNTGAEQVMAGFLVDYPTLPSLVSVSPSSGAQGSTLSGVMITGNLTNWVQGTTEAILGAGVTVSNLSIIDATHATATIAISPTAPVGGNSVVMITGAQTVSGSGFSVTPSAAFIQSVEPNFICPTEYTNNIAGFNCTPGSSPTGVPVVGQLQTVTLNIIGVGTHWLQGETVVSFGPGVVIDQLTVSSPTTAQVQITVLSSAPVGFAKLSTSSDGEVVSLQQAIDIEEGSPTLLVITPSSGQQGTTLNLQILGRFTHFNSTAGSALTSAAFNQDITVNSITVIDSENMIANISVSPLAYVDFGSPCGHDLTITTGNEQVSTGAITDNFCVVQGAEEITTVNPAAGIQGSTESVTITGSATDFINGESTVSFGDSGISTGTVVVNSPTSLTVPVAISTSSSVGFHTVTVTTLGEVANQQFAFTVSPGVATLNEAIPNQAEQGVQGLSVRLIGQYSHFNAQSTATFGAGITVLSHSFVSPTEIDATINIDPLSYAGGRLVTVSSPGVPCSDQPAIAVTGLQYAGCTPGVPTGTGTEIVSANVFTIIPGPAIISNVAPNTGNEGQEVVFNITGSATHWQQNFTQFYIAGGGSDLTINSVVVNSATSATVDMSISPTANPGARSIYMVTNGESLTDSGAFVVTGGVPVITYLSPNSQQNNPTTGTTGLLVNIYGLYTNWTAGASTPTFGPGITVESFQVDNATHIEAVINIAANAQDGYRTVVVQTGTQALTGNFLVTAPAPPPTPYIWYLSPGSALPGQTLTVTFNGAYTQWDPVTTVLEGFATGITVNTFQVTSATTARANITIPANATASLSDLTLTTPNTTNNPTTEVDNAQFSVVIAQPRLTVVDPGSGLQGANDLTVNILGQYTTFDSTTTFSFGPNITVNGPPVILGPTIATQSISIPILAPLGGVSVVASTPDAAPIAQVVGGAGFSITPSLALISTIVPNTSPQGSTISVAITGQNTHWNGSTTFQFGDGIVVTGVTVNSETSATLTLAIPAYAGEGPTGATAHTFGEVANITNGFVVTAGTPYLLSSGPGSVPQQGAAVFTILSQATTWTSANPPVVSFGPWITVTNVNVTGPTSLTVDGFALPTAPVGYYNLTVSTGTQVLGLNNAVYIRPGPAVVNSVTPSSGNQNTNLPAVQITGINTHWVQGTTQLTFPDVLINSFTVNSPTLITANISVNATAPAGQYSVTATTGGEVATGINVFTVVQSQPELLAVVPTSGPQGLTSSPVNITGDFTNFVNGTTTANFGTGITVNSVTVTSATTAQANITVSPTTTLGFRNVSVATGAEVVSLSNAYQVIQGPAEIVGALSPSSGAQGHLYNVLITGSQTHFAQNTTVASFGGGIQVTGVTVNSLLSATVGISIPNSTPAGAYDVVLTTGGEVATILGGFTVTSGSAQISVVNPPTGTQGSTFNVNLTGVFTHWVNLTSVASFGAGIVVNSLHVTDATDAVANITIDPTAAIASRTVSVTTGSEVATITGGFSVLAGVPTLLTASPGTAQAGTTGNIVITGTFTNFQQAFTTVNFGSGVTVNTVTVSSLTQLTANITVASNATVGARTIQVNTNSQNLQLTGAFSVTAGTPVITQINPNIGNPSQTLDVTINGLYTVWVNGTTTASFGAGITVNTVTVSNPTTLTANITISSGAALGPVDVKTTTGGEMETVPGGFTVQSATIPPPSLLSISPGVNAGGIPINSNFTFVFSQPMNRTTINTSTVEFWLVSNPGGWVTLPGTVSVDAAGRVATFTPTSPLAVNSQYYMLLTNGIKDATGNTFPQYGYESFYTVDSATTTPVTVVAANPPANATNVGTNVIVELEFSANMLQPTETGLVVSTGGSPVAGTWSWNSNVSCCSWGPGTLLYFTPTAPYTPGTTYKVSYGAPLADTAGNALTPGFFNFKTGTGADTAQNSTGANFQNNEANLGTNFAPQFTYAKPINPIDINTGTVLLYNGDSGKYVAGAVTVAPNGLSSTFTPTYPLLPNTRYYLHQSCGNYDMDGNYLNCLNQYFDTGAGSDTTAPTVASIWPASNATSVPLNAQITVHFSAPINPGTVSNAVTVTPSGGSAIAGTAVLSSDLVTLTFVPTSPLKPGTVFTVHVSGYQDMVGNSGTPFNSNFTTAISIQPLIVSTGIDSSGNAILVGDTVDPHWSVFPTAGTSGETTIHYPGTSPLYTVASGEAGWYGGWDANGPQSSWIVINPNSATGNSFGFYSTPFNLPGILPAYHLCLVGAMSHDDSGLLAVNGQPIMTDQGFTGSSLTPLNIDITSFVNPGLNYLTFAFGATDNNLEGLRLQGAIEACGASFTGGLSLVNATPANATTSVPTNSTITLTFNNPLDPATVNDTTLPVMVTWNSSQIIAGTWAVNPANTAQATFTPDSPFPINTTIYVGNCNGPFDTAGDTYPGCYSIQLLQFTTGGTVTPPGSSFQVMAFAPAANATNVGLRAPVTATFNRSFAPGSINPNSASSDVALFLGDGQSPWCSSVNRSQDNATLSFNCYPLPSSSTMTAILNSNLTDWSGNPLTNFSSQFTTSQYDSNTNGTVITSRPGNGASGINANEPITIYTDLPINPATANGGIEVAQNNIAVTGTVAVLDNGFTLEFTPSAPWTPGALIQWWTNTSMLDSTYNTPINGASGYFYAAASTSTLVPAVQVTSPPQYTNPVALNTVFDVQFNTPLNASTVIPANVFIFDNSNGNLHIPVTITQPQPNEIRLTPTGTLPVNHYLYVQLTTGLQSATSVPLASNASWYEYTGTANDTTLPTIVSAVPYNGSTNVGVNVAPGVVISKPIDPVTVNSSTFTVTNGGTPLAGSFWFNSADTRIEFVPNAPLPAGTPLVMTINGVTDLVGHAISFSSNFTTGPGPDFVQPTIVHISAYPNESIPTNSTITVQFSESMDVTTFSDTNFFIQDQLLGVHIPATLTWSADQSVAYLVPNSPLAAGRQYYFYVYSGTDLAGNAVQGTAFYLYAEFTGAAAAPTVLNFNPLNGFTGLGTNAIIEAQFSAPIDPNTVGGVTLKTGGSTVATSPSLGAGNTVLQLIPAVPLLPNTTYAFNITGVKDPAGNLVTTVLSTFTTGATYDINPATATLSDPAYNTTVGTNVVPKLVFNKPINPITVNNSTFRMYLVDTNQWIPLTVTESTDGLEVTMTPQIPLLPNTRYHFQACCGFQDQDGNSGNQVDEYFWTNGGPDTTAPTVTVTPLDTASSIPLNAQVTATLSANIDPTTVTQSSIVVKKGGIAIAGAVTQPTNTELVFTPASPLIASTGYAVQVSGFKDANGLAVVPSNTTFTTGTVAASGGLTLLSTNIVNGATVTSYTQQIILTFSQILDPSTVNASTLKVLNTWNSNNGLDGTYVVNGAQVTFTPAIPYPAGTEIFVGECGGPTDVLGDVFLNGSCYGQQLVYFFTPSGTSDTTPLTVMSVSPASGATNVRPDVSVSVTFNKSINPYSVYNNGNNALLFAGQGLQDRGTITMSADNRTMTFSSGTLYTNATYTIQLPAGGISDPSGNTLANTYTSIFKTGGNPAAGNGSVQATAPGANATGVPTDTDLTLYMNRQVDASTLPGQLTVTVNGALYSGTVQAVASGYEIQFLPAVQFPNGAVVQWFLSANVLDVNGDGFTGNSGTFYTVATVNAATAVPTVIAVSPTVSSSNVPVNAQLDLQYSQPIDGTTLSGNVYLYDNGDNNTPPATATITQPSPTVVRLTPTSPLTPSTQYLVCSNGSVKGTNGVNAQSDCWALNFNTVATPTSDTTSGTVIIGPPNNSQNVGTNAYIRFRFSKPVDTTTINPSNIAVKIGANPVPGTWSYNYTNNDVREVNFSPVNPLPPSTPILVSTSGLLDYAGNEFTPVNATFTTAALPDYSQPTVALDFTYWQPGVATNASFTCHYSTPMDPSSVTPSNTYIYSYVTNGNIPVTYAWSVDMMAVTMTPAAPLFANSQYIYYCNGAIDLTGNGQQNGSAGFYTGNGPSSAGPVLVTANPPNGSTNVALNSIGGPWNNTSLMLLFNEPVATESMANITFTPNGGSAEPIAVYPEDGNFIADVQLPWEMLPNTTYTFNVAGVTDLNGNLATPATSSFTTGTGFDWTPPTATAATPANNAIGVAVNAPITLTFSEAMNPVLITPSQIYLRLHNQTSVVIPGTLTVSPDYKTVTVTPTSPLAESTIYDLMYWPNNWYLYDIAGNAETQYGIETTFTTGIAAAVNGACGSANGLTFSAPPAANLCSAGTASPVTNPGSWTWTCNGQYSGTNASCSAIVSGVPACSPQLSSLQGLWSAGPNNTNDYSPNGYNGTLMNFGTNPPYALGEVGDAFNLTTNSPSADEYILIGQPVPANLQIQSAITLGAWIYPTALPTDNGSGAIGIIAGSQHDGNFAGATIYYDARNDPDSVTGAPPGHITFNLGDGTNWYIQDTLSQVPLNQWTFVTATATSGASPKVYFNGVLQPSSSGQYPSTWNGTVSYSGSWFGIGQEVNENRPFIGLINDVQVYNAALTQAQIHAIYIAGSGGVCQ